MRRAFFNSTPPKLSYDPPTTTSQVDNTITGKVTVIDRDGDTVTLSASTPPINGGTVVVNPDGTFTYTVPTTLYTTGGTDTFTITATDLNSSGHIHGLRGLLNNITFGLVGSPPGHTAATTLTLDIAAATAPIPATPPAYTLAPPNRAPVPCPAKSTSPTPPISTSTP